MKNKIITWIKRQVKNARAKGVVLGLSGGIDSCVVAVLAAKALGKKNVLALLMPCHSQPQDARDALVLARKFGIKTVTVDLTGVYDTMLRILPPADTMTKANLRPRLRMAVLYYYARKMNYLVCGTSNKSEILAGYFTKHGDGASDILPIGGLLKTQVWELARELKIPEPLIIKVPTAGLWPGQTDEDDMGILYSELDDVIARMEKNKPQRLPKEKVARVKRMIAGSEHKRRRAAVCIV